MNGRKTIQQFYPFREFGTLVLSATIREGRVNLHTASFTSDCLTYPSGYEAFLLRSFCDFTNEINLPALWGFPTPDHDNAWWTFAPKEKPQRLSQKPQSCIISPSPNGSINGSIGFVSKSWILPPCPQPNGGVHRHWMPICVHTLHLAGVPDDEVEPIIRARMTRSPTPGEIAATVRKIYGSAWQPGDQPIKPPPPLIDTVRRAKVIADSSVKLVDLVESSPFKSLSTARTPKRLSTFYFPETRCCAPHNASTGSPPVPEKSGAVISPEWRSWFPAR